MKTATSPIRQIGVPYARDYIEVQVQGESGNWSVKSRNCETVEQAEKQIAEAKEADKFLSQMVNLGKWPKHRLVQVKAECVVLKVI